VQFLVSYQKLSRNDIDSDVMECHPLVCSGHSSVTEENKQTKSESIRCAAPAHLPDWNTLLQSVPGHGSMPGGAACLSRCLLSRAARVNDLGQSGHCIVQVAQQQ